jgi:hypothetical protein
MVKPAQHAKSPRESLCVSPSAAILYRHLDVLISLRIEIADGTVAERLLATHSGMARLREVRQVMDGAIRDLKRIIASGAQPRQPLLPMIHRRRAKTRQGQHVAVL